MKIFYIEIMKNTKKYKFEKYKGLKKLFLKLKRNLENNKLNLNIIIDL
jgi:hypothetical protein